jgi:hypothetical protein
MTKNTVKMLLKLQSENPNNTYYTTETYIAALITTANILTEELKP